MNKRGAVTMSPIAFDTLAYANKLKAAGADPKVAEAQSEATAEILNDLVTSQLATKQDLKELEVATRSDMKELETSLRSDMKELEISLRSDMKELDTSLRSAMKELEMRLQTTFFKMIVTSILILSGLQALFHFFGK